MTTNALDLALPGIYRNVRENGLSRIALVAPLRGGLALVTPETVAHLQEWLDSLGLKEVTIELWAQGIKRYPQEDRAEVYFASGYEGSDNANVHAVILDWGTATGLTNVYGAYELRKHGVGYGRMTSVSMALADKGRERMLRDCADETGTITIEAATRAQLNEVDYVVAIAPADGGEFREISPKDWGAKMWGMENDGTLVAERKAEVDFFIDTFGKTFAGFVTAEQIENLRKFYYTRYLS